MLLEDFHSNQEYFDKSYTDMPTYDDMMKDPEYFQRAKKKVWDIVYMSPDDYINNAIEGFSKIGYGRDAVMSRDADLIDKYAGLMRDGTKFPMVVLDYSGYMGAEDEFSQEGMHRALAAKKLGLKRMPVLVVKNAPKK